MIVFSKEWFIKHQRKLLWLANTSFGRWLLRIHNDCPKDKRIVKLLPNCYTWANEDGTVTTDFRTHNKFAKRLYYGLKPLWHILHFWDWLVADKWILELSFGFDTLTTYPAAGANSPCDGWVRRTGVSEIFSTIRTGVGSDVSVVQTSGIFLQLISSVTSNQYETIRRGIFLFDTSSIPNSTSIQSGSFSLYGVNKANTLNLTDGHASLTLSAVSPASTSTLAASDYNIANWGSTRFATDFSYAAYSITVYNDMALNASGLAAIDKAGITKLGTRLAVDFDNGTPNWVSSQGTSYYAYFADQTGVSQDPKLVVNYVLMLISIDSMLLKADITKAFSADGILQKEFIRPLSTDSLLNKSNIIKSLSADSLLNKADITLNLFIDAFLSPYRQTRSYFKKELLRRFRFRT